MSKLERQLIHLLIIGDESAFEIIYNKYSDRVYNLAFLILKDSGWSEDVVQEVFVKLWKSKSNLQVAGDLWVYLYVLTKRESLNKVRSISRSNNAFERLWKNISSFSECSHEKLVGKEFSNHIDNLIAKLPPRQQDVFTLSRYEGLTHQEIANKLDISPNTVKNHMVQALKSIREHTLDHNATHPLMLFLASFCF